MNPHQRILRMFEDTFSLDTAKLFLAVRLLSKTVLITKGRKSGGISVNHYKKAGGLKMATEDFIKLKPTNVKTVGVCMYTST